MKNVLFVLITALLLVFAGSSSLYQNQNSVNQKNTTEETLTSHNLQFKNYINQCVILDTSNPYWDKITIKGTTTAQYKINEEDNIYVVELPDNFIDSVFQMEVNNIPSQVLKVFKLQNLSNNQYLYVAPKTEHPIRIYTDDSTPNYLYIDISKTFFPYHSSVVIDPGHGGMDSGAFHKNIHEKDIVLDIAKKMEHKLKDKGINALYTRTTDVEISTKNRVAYSNTITPDLFVSIHNNSFERPEPNGISTYYYTPNGYQKEERLQLATIVQNDLMKEFSDWTDMGVRKESLIVLRETKQPSILVEFGFISNAKDLENLSKPEIRERAAQAISQGIIEYLSSIKDFLK